MVRNKRYFDIRDGCRKGLLKYLEGAIALIPAIIKPQILDAGCGTGIPTLYAVERLKGRITAIDPDPESIAVLEERVNDLKLVGTVCPFKSSLFDLEADNNQFDLIIAEGLLNIVGFKKGFLKMLTLLNRPGFMVIHDTNHENLKKREFIESTGGKILGSFELDEKVWWSEYYQCLEREIALLTSKDLIGLFAPGLSEIESYKKHPSQFKSRYYVIQVS